MALDHKMDHAVQCAVSATCRVAVSAAQGAVSTWAFLGGLWMAVSGGELPHTAPEQMPRGR